MKRLTIVIVITTGLLSGCTKPESAREILSSNGYTRIEITGYNYFSCGDSDTFKTGFTAISSNGTRVSGTVCSGWLKGSTIRFD